MTKTIAIARNLNLPIDTAVVQRYAFVGTVGSGKTNSAMLLMESFLENSVQVVVIDPAGVWWSLRAAANDASKPSGLNINVIGGKNADVPIDPERGAIYADWIIEKGASAVFDLKMLRPGAREKFVTEFLRQLYYRKGSHKVRSPLHLVIEEAQRYAPQHPEGKDDKMSLSVIREIAELGRNDGFGLSLVTQRPQAVHKGVLNLTECLFAHKTNGKHERKAIMDWAVDKQLSIGDTDLTTLEIGQAWVWSPTWLKVLNKFSIRQKRTYNASSTLKFGESMSNVAPPLPEKALAELKGALADATKHVEEHDVKALQKRIKELEARQPIAATVSIDYSKDALRQEYERGSADGFENGYRAGGKDILEKFSKLIAEAKGSIENACTLLKSEKFPATTQNARQTKSGLHPGAQAMLSALQCNYPRHYTWQETAILAGILTGNGYFYAAKKDLLASGAITVTTDDRVRANDASVLAPISQEEIVNIWVSKLQHPAPVMLSHIFKNKEMTQEALSAAIKTKSGNGYWYNGLSKLRKAGLIEQQGQLLRITELLR